MGSFIFHCVSLILQWILHAFFLTAHGHEAKIGEIWQRPTGNPLHPLAWRCGALSTQQESATAAGRKTPRVQMRRSSSAPRPAYFSFAHSSPRSTCCCLFPPASLASAFGVAWHGGPGHRAPQLAPWRSEAPWVHPRPPTSSLEPC